MTKPLYRRLALLSLLSLPLLAIPPGQAAARQKAGRIIAAGMTKEVTFELVDGPINDRIDDAYRAKYHGSPYLSPMIGARARSATVKVMLREKQC